MVAMPYNKVLLRLVITQIILNQIQQIWNQDDLKTIFIGKKYNEAKKTGLMRTSSRCCPQTYCKYLC